MGLTTVQRYVTKHKQINLKLLGIVQNRTNILKV